MLIVVVYEDYDHAIVHMQHIMADLAILGIVGVGSFQRCAVLESGFLERGIFLSRTLPISRDKIQPTDR